MRPFDQRSFEESKHWEPIGDCGHDLKDNFRTLDYMKIQPLIKVRSNSVATGENLPRDNSVLEQLRVTRNRQRNRVTECDRWQNPPSPRLKEPLASFGKSIKSLKWKTLWMNSSWKCCIRRVHGNEKASESRLVKNMCTYSVIQHGTNNHYESTKEASMAIVKQGLNRLIVDCKFATWEKRPVTCWLVGSLHWSDTSAFFHKEDRSSMRSLAIGVDIS